MGNPPGGPQIQNCGCQGMPRCIVGACEMDRSDYETMHEADVNW